MWPWEPRSDTSLVTVTADLAERNVVANSGLDVTEHAGHDYVEVVLHTPADPDVDGILHRHGACVAHFDATTETTTGLIEAWTMTCGVDGVVVEQVPVIVDRGQRVTVDLDVCGPAEANGQATRGAGKGNGPKKS